MSCRLMPVRMPDSASDPLAESSFIVGYQVACQARLPRGDAPESQVAEQRSPFHQHGLKVWISTRRAPKPLSLLFHSIGKTVRGERREGSDMLLPFQLHQNHLDRRIFRSLPGWLTTDGSSRDHCCGERSNKRNTGEDLEIRGWWHVIRSDCASQHRSAKCSDPRKA